MKKGMFRFRFFMVIVALLTSFFVDHALASGEPRIKSQKMTINWQYQGSEDKIFYNHSQIKSFADLDDENYISDNKILKTIFLVDLSNTIVDYLTRYHAQCSGIPPFNPDTRGLSSESNDQNDLNSAFYQAFQDCVKKKKLLADEFFAEIDKLNQRISTNSENLSFENIFASLDMMRTLAQNMKNATSTPTFENDLLDQIVNPRLKFYSNVNVTGGGSKDIGWFRKLIDEGEVPRPDCFSMEGFLSEFDLSLNKNNTSCNGLICLNSAVATYQDKIYIQLAMNSSLKESVFTRKPLNLSIVLDVSGSMGDKDDTEKSRLEWAKETIANTINHLNENDLLSIVIFDTESNILLPPTPVTEKESILNIIDPLEPRSTTNLESGLRSGFEQVSTEYRTDYNNRVILISDAGLNTGVTDDASILNLINDYAKKDIGLTAIGLGSDFNQHLIRQITISKGGNYIYVHSGKEMYKYFQNFNFLVSPIAYDFKAHLTFQDSNLHLVNTFGIPKSSLDVPNSELIDITTLFISPNQGGAILLEYKK